MKVTLKMQVYILLLTLTIFSSTFAQYPEDVLRLSNLGLGIGARSLSLGTAYSSVANDFSAVYWNPAGLGQIKWNELSLGLSHLSYENTSTYYNRQQSFTNSATNLNDFGIVYPFPTTRGSLVFAIGYGRQSDFTTGLSFRGFNPNSSIIQYWAPDGQSTERPPQDNLTYLAYRLWLANLDSVYHNNYRLHSKIFNRLTQSGKVLEGGGLNNIIISGAIEAARNLFIGGTVNFITGSYSYLNNYYENDLADVYNDAAYYVISNGKDTVYYDFHSLFLNESVESDFSGFSMKAGILYKVSSGSSFSFTVKTPSWISVQEKFSQKGSSEFDNGDYFSYTLFDNQENEYDVTTPFVLGVGASHPIQNLLLSAEAEFTDWTQMEFRNANQRLLNLNTVIKEIFRPTVNFKGGVEYLFNEVGLRLRGGFAYLPSPYKNDPTSYDQKYITGGAGFVVEDAIAIDIGYAHGFWQTSRLIYDLSDQNGKPTAEVKEKIRTHNIIATVAYRF